MIKHFSSADVYLLSGIWLVCLDHYFAGYFCLVFAIVDAIVCASKDEKDTTK